MVESNAVVEDMEYDENRTRYDGGRAAAEEPASRGGLLTPTQIALSDSSPPELPAACTFAQLDTNSGSVSG
ncbi:hypothetical protein ONZ51_g10059 [Trametes cubensis]|uniref:Uncharacterized protein n=1 Tax=Trametes cubensis TaxID=1111947 RepID=A0AAD7TKM7_9APHY|nr:hypothetical protein ONZ51_g10059 [Trametes cubensis]